MLTLAHVLAAVALAAPAPAEASVAPPGATVKVSKTQYGRILVDGRGFALYAFTRDGRGPSRCHGDCAAAWPPLLTTSKRVAARRPARRSLVGTVRRDDGTLQVTYRGRPLYFYVGDRSPGQVLCQDVVEFGGTWLVVRASGRLVR